MLTKPAKEFQWNGEAWLLGKYVRNSCNELDTEQTTEIDLKVKQKKPHLNYTFRLAKAFSALDHQANTFHKRNRMEEAKIVVRVCVIDKNSRSESSTLFTN